MVDPEQGGDVIVEHQGVIKRAETVSIAKMAAFQILVAGFVRRWRTQRMERSVAGRLGSSNWLRLKLARPRDKQVQNVTYLEFLKLLKDGNEVLIAFYDNENVIPDFEEVG
jgi:hypothetical protein